MPKLGDMFPSRFVSAGDLAGETVVTIEKVTSEAMYDQREGKKVNKWLVHFHKATKAMILNKTNAEAIALVTGSDNTADWIGKQVTLYPVSVNVAGQMRLAVRVKTPEKNGGAQPGSAAEPPPPEDPPGNDLFPFENPPSQFDDTPAGQMAKELAMLMIAPPDQALSLVEELGLLSVDRDEALRRGRKYREFCDIGAPHKKAIELACDR